MFTIINSNREEKKCRAFIGSGPAQIADVYDLVENSDRFVMVVVTTIKEVEV